MLAAASSTKRGSQSLDTSVWGVDISGVDISISGGVADGSGGGGGGGSLLYSIDLGSKKLSAKITTADSIIRSNMK